MTRDEARTMYAELCRQQNVPTTLPAAQIVRIAALFGITKPRLPAQKADKAA